MWRPLLVGLVLTASVGEVLANGRAPATSTIHFRRGAENEIAAGMTFGLLLSHDGGNKWFYMCEDAVGYGGMYDPHYAYTDTGALFATTFNGLKVMRDGCVFGETPAGMKFVSEVKQGGDGAIYFSSTDKLDNGVFGSCTAEPPAPRTCSDGTSFPIKVKPGLDEDWWQSIRIAPSDPKRVYLSGYRLIQGQPKVFLLFRSNDGGQTFAPLPVTDFAVMLHSTIDLVGVSHTNPDLVYARVTLEDNSVSDAIYRSTNGGQTWQRVLGLPGAMSFVVRRNGDLVVGTQLQGTHVSTTNGASWTEVAGAPHINCLEENSAGEVWACTQNFGSMTVPGDGFGIMKSSNLTSWTGVLKFQDIERPVTCPGGTVQADKCDAQLWCGLCAQLGCDPKRECAGIGDDAGADDAGFVVPKQKGSCSTGDGGAWALVLVGLGFIIIRRRR